MAIVHTTPEGRMSFSEAEPKKPDVLIRMNHDDAKTICDEVEKLRGRRTITSALDDFLHGLNCWLEDVDGE